MKKENKVQDYQITIDQINIGKFPLKYLSIHGLERTELEISTMLLPSYIKVESYYTDKINVYPFNKPISKIVIT